MFRHGLTALVNRGCLATMARRGRSTTSDPAPEVIIIGAGIIGCSIALSLNRRGIRTLNLDKGPGAGSGSTSYSSGIVRTFYTARESAKFAWEGLHYWENWAEHVGHDGAAEGGLARLRTCGAVLPRTAANADFLDKVVAHSVALGIPHEEWSAARAAAALGWDTSSFHPPHRIDDERFGASRPHGIESAVHFPRTGYVSDPLLACCNLEAAARATGLASFRYGAGAAVTAVLRGEGVADGGRVMGVCVGGTSSGGGDETLHAPVVVNAAGPHSSKITALAFGDEGWCRTTWP